MGPKKKKKSKHLGVNCIKTRQKTFLSGPRYNICLKLKRSQKRLPTSNGNRNKRAATAVFKRLLSPLTLMLFVRPFPVGAPEGNIPQETAKHRPALLLLFAAARILESQTGNDKN